MEEYPPGKNREDVIDEMRKDWLGCDRVPIEVPPSILDLLIQVYDDKARYVGKKNKQLRIEIQEAHLALLRKQDELEKEEEEREKAFG